MRVWLELELQRTLRKALARSESGDQIRLDRSAAEDLLALLAKQLRATDADRIMDEYIARVGNGLNRVWAVHILAKKYKKTPNACVVALERKRAQARRCLEEGREPRDHFVHIVEALDPLPGKSSGRLRPPKLNAPPATLVASPPEATPPSLDVR